MQIVDFPRLDRARILRMTGGQAKTTLMQASGRDPAYFAYMVREFFRAIAPAAAEQLGPIALLFGISTIRHHWPGGADKAPWHTDAKFFAPEGVGLTIWCPFDDVGKTSPSLTLRTEAGEISPIMAPGQALILPPDVEHKTQDIEGERLSIDFRCVPVERMPTGELVQRSPKATRRRWRGQVGVLVEDDTGPVTFIPLPVAPVQDRIPAVSH